MEDKKYNTDMQRLLAERTQERNFEKVTEDYQITENNEIDTAFPAPDAEYMMLLKKFMYSKDLQKLLEMCIVDDIKSRERARIMDGRYPDQERNLVAKLLYELQTARAYDDINKQYEAKEREKEELMAKGGK